MPKLTVKIEAVTKGLNAGLNNAKSSFKKFSSSVNGFGNSIKGVGVGLAAFGVGIIGTIAKIGGMAGQLVQTQLAMETFLGSTEKAKQLIGDLRKFADVTPFDTNSVIQAGKVLAGAGVKAEGVVDVIKMLGDISAGTGKDLGEMASLYAKSLNKGKVQTRELLQLINAGVPIIDKLAQSMGKPKDSIFKLAETGKIKFKDLNKAFKDMTSGLGIYAGLMDKQSKTLLGRWSTLQGKIQNLTADVGGPLQGSLTSITETFINWTEQARKSRGPLGLLIKDLQTIADVLELTRDSGDLGKQTGLKGIGKADIATDALASLGVMDSGSSYIDALNPLNILETLGKTLQNLGLGSSAIGARSGLNTGMSQAESDRLDAQEVANELLKEVVNNTGRSI